MSKPSSFVGNIPLRYDRGLGPMFFERFAEDLASRVTGSSILELAAGTGIVTQRLIASLPEDGRMVVTDLNQPMLDIAQSKIADPRVLFETMDAGNITLPDQSFDCVVCQFGLMFFPDKAAALAHTNRVLKSGGKALFNVWDSLSSNPVASVTHETIVEAFPDDPPLFYQTPFSLHDRSAVEQLFREAGFSQVVGETLSFDCLSPTVAQAVEGLIQGNPVSAEIQERGNVAIETLEGALAEKLKSRFGDNPMRSTLQAHVITAVKA